MIRLVIIIVSIFGIISAFGETKNEIENIRCVPIEKSIIYEIDSIIYSEYLSNEEIKKCNDNIDYYDVDIVIALSEDTVVINPCNVNLSNIRCFQVYVRRKHCSLTNKYIIDCDARKYSFKSFIEDIFYPTNQLITMRLRNSNKDESIAKIFIDDIIEFAEPPIWKFVYNGKELISKTTWTESNIFHVDYD